MRRWFLVEQLGVGDNDVRLKSSHVITELGRLSRPPYDRHIRLRIQPAPQFMVPTIVVGGDEYANWSAAIHDRDPTIGNKSPRKSFHGSAIP